MAFAHESKDLMGVVHGDDLVFVGPDEELDFVLKVLKSRYELKDRGRLGLGPNDKNNIDMLGRILEISSEGITWSGDPRHLKLLESHFGMNDAPKTLSKNGYPEEDTDDTELSQAEAREYRMLALRLNYMAQDNPYMQFPAKEACRGMARPKVQDFKRQRSL